MGEWEHPSLPLFPKSKDPLYLVDLAYADEHLFRAVTIDSRPQFAKQMGHGVGASSFNQPPIKPEPFGELCGRICKAIDKP